MCLIAKLLIFSGTQLHSSTKWLLIVFLMTACHVENVISCSLLLVMSYGPRFSRMDQVKFVEDSL